MEPFLLVYNSVNALPRLEPLVPDDNPVSVQSFAEKNQLDLFTML